MRFYQWVYDMATIHLQDHLGNCHTMRLVGLYGETLLKLKIENTCYGTVSTAEYYC